MTQSSELLEIAQNGVAQIVERHDQEAIEAKRHIWFATVVFVLGLSMFVGVNIWLQQRTETLISEPHPAVVSVDFTVGKECQGVVR